MRQASSRTDESFRDLLLRYRGRSGLTQRQLADGLGINRRSAQEWENGATYPSAERLEALILLLLQAHGLTAGQEMAEAQALWAAVQRQAPHTHAPFDQAWFAQVLAQRAAPAAAPTHARASSPAIRTVESDARATERRQDWGEAPDTTEFVGRTSELETLRRWVLEERCRLVAILGIGGIGKTSLAAKLAQEAAPSFERVYWRSLRDALPTRDWLGGAIGFVSDQQVVPPGAESERLTTLLRLLRERRCLLVLDNFRTVLEPGELEGRYRAGLEEYGRVLQALGAAAHQSCLVLTSREAPAELALLGSDAVRSFPLGGLELEEVQALLAPKQLAGSRQQWAAFITRFGGNGLALKLVGESIRELFGGDLGSFLEETGTSSVFGDIRRLLDEQLDRNSRPEQLVLRVLAVAREPVTLKGLLLAVGSHLERGIVLQALEALRRRSLVERAEAPGAAAFTLVSVVLEYVTDRLVETAADEIEHGQPVLLVEQPLILAHAMDYARQTQERLIGRPILERLKQRLGEAGTERRLLVLLDSWRDQAMVQQGYGPGNVVNLLRLLRGYLRGLDLSRLTLRQAYLAEVEAQDASLADAHLADTVLAAAFDFPTSVALSADGTLLVTGTSTGEVRLWRVADRTPLWAVPGHIGAVWDVALSADGQVLASGGGDATVRVWEAATGEPLTTLQGHSGAVRSVALSADGQLLASGSFDGSVRVWDPATIAPVAILQGHTGAVYDVALSADGRLLASGGADGTVRLWDVSSGQPLATLPGNTCEVWDVSLPADGRLVASGGGDGTVRLWDTGSGQPLARLQGHTGTVRRVALSADGRVVASGAADGSVRLWQASPAQPLATLPGQIGTVWAVALSPNGRLLASGGADGRVRLWEASTGRSAATLEGHPNPVQGVALSADGRLVASSGTDGSVRLWDAKTGRLLATLLGHTGEVWGVTLSADSRLVVSAGEDGTVRLWEAGTQRALATLQGHSGAVRRVALSADGRLLASGGADGSVRLWDPKTGRLLVTLHGHTNAVWGVAVSADARLVASASTDGTVRLWDPDSGRPLATLRGHTGEVWGVALSADGRLVASSGTDGTVQLWDATTGRPLATLRGHTGVVFGVAVSAEGHLLCSGGLDGTVRLWEAGTGACLRTIRPERRYERLDITGLTGITAAQRAALLDMGAVEQRPPPP